MSSIAMATAKLYFLFTVKLLELMNFSAGMQGIFFITHTRTSSVLPTRLENLYTGLKKSTSNTE